ncbi:protein of unknown function DUF1833 [Erwinia phage Gungnir39]|nr:protein of unknown function DUF1833 [Erwinia phage Gungnir39]
MTSKALNVLYASSGDDVILDTLQISIGANNIYLVKAYDDVIATTEAGVQVTFQAAGIDIALPKRNADGTQDLQFAVSNIFGEVSSLVRPALNRGDAGLLTYRRYVSSDLGAPAEAPYSLVIKSGQWTNTEAQIIAGYADILDTAWPRFRYTVPFAPGLRYLG